MFDIVTDRPIEVVGWIFENYQIQLVPPLTAIGICDHDQWIGAAIFNGFEARNIELTCLGKGAFSRHVCRTLAQIAFIANGCERITIRTRADNDYVRRVAAKFGWKEEGRLRNYYGDCDCIIMGMLKSECRFLKVPKHVYN